MSWFGILKAELAKPAVDVTTGKSPTEECCSKTIEYMKSKGTTGIQGYIRINQNLPVSDDNIEWRGNAPLDELNCEFIYEWLEQAALSDRGMNRTKVKARMAKYKDFLDYWDKCMKEKGNAGMEL
tara:strand:- start:180 stop:554 length:375 start_codon:yes stop_codon:yes gene_type:complete